MHERSYRTIGHAEIATPIRTPLPPLLCVMYTGLYVYAVARARAALGYADERQIKMHNPGKSFRIFHNGREISLLAARAIHPFVQPPPRGPPLAQSPREFVGDRALRARTRMEGDRGSRDIHIHARVHTRRDGERGRGIYHRVERGRKRSGGLGGWKGAR